VEATTFSAVFAGISATVAAGSAVGSWVSARRSRSAKTDAENKRDEAVTAAQAAADALRSIATTQETAQIEMESAQAARVGFVPSPVGRGRTGWRVQNDSDAPITAVEVSTTTSAKIVVYRGSGPDNQDHYDEPVISAGQTTPRMFRPADSDAAAANPAEVERMIVRFTDARGQRWERTGSQAPQPAE
jgi:hypothetical protein